MKAKLIKVENRYELFTQGFLKGSTNHELIDSLNVEEGSIRYKLSLKNCQVIENGYDLDELANKYGIDDMNDDIYFSFIAGFQKCLEILGDKKFSEEDMLQAFLKGVSLQIDAPTFQQSLQQTEWDVEIVMEYVGECKGNNNDGCFQDSPGHDCGCYEYKPKLDTDGCLILKRVV